MRLLYFFILTFSYLNSYYLAVDNYRDAERMNKLNFQCDKKLDNYFVCLESDNKTKLIKIQDFLKNMYSINSYVLDQNKLNNKKFGMDEIGRDSIDNAESSSSPRNENHISVNEGGEELETNIDNSHNHMSKEEFNNFNEGIENGENKINDTELYEKNKKLLEAYQKSMHGHSTEYSTNQRSMHGHSTEYSINDYSSQLKHYNNYSSNENKYNDHYSNENRENISNHSDEYKSNFSLENLEKDYKHNLDKKSSVHNNSIEENHYYKKEPISHINSDFLDDDIKPKYSSNITSSGYCIQIATSPKFKDMERLYRRYKKYPLSRIEKIGNYYVLRVGEADSVKKLDSLLSDIRMIKYDAFVRRCDFDLNRIIKINRDDIKVEGETTLSDEEILGGLDRDLEAPSKTNYVKNKVISKCVCPSTVNQDEDPVKKMYSFLSKGELKKAEEIANSLEYIKPVDAYTVLGIISLRKGKTNKAYEYFQKAKEAKENDLLDIGD